MNRIDPVLSVGAMKTYQVSMPLPTHWREASCAEVECEAYRTGWITLIDERESSKIGDAEWGAYLRWAKYQNGPSPINGDQARCYYIRHLSGRRFIEAKDDSGVTVFDFAPGQTCFGTHRIKLDRPQIHIVHGGDWRGNPRRETRIHQRPEDWQEDFSEHQDRIATRVNRG